MIDPPRAPARHGIGLGVAVLAIGVLVSRPGIWSYDGYVMAQVAHSMVADHTFLVHDDPLGLSTPYAAYGIGMPVLMAVGEYLARYLPVTATGVDALINPVILAAIAVVVFLLARGRGAGPRLGVAVGLAVALATPLLPYAATSFTEPATALGVALALLGIQRAARRPVHAGALVGAGVGLAAVMRVDSLALIAPVVGLGLLVVAGVRRPGRRAAHLLRAAIACAATLAPFLAIVAAYNQVRYGSMLQTQYQGFAADRAWSHPWATGVYGLVASPGRGLLLYAPVALVIVLFWRPVARRSPVLALVCAALLVDRVATYAAWHDWHGGVTWGPRFLVPAMPALAPFLTEALRRASAGLRDRSTARVAVTGVLGLIGLSLGVQLVGALTDPAQDRMLAAIHEGEAVRPPGLTYGEWAASAQEQAIWDAAMMDWSVTPVVDHADQLVHGDHLVSRFIGPGVDPIGLAASATVLGLGLLAAFGGRRRAGGESALRGAARRPAEALAQDDPERLDAVHPRDLLAVGAGPGLVGDRHLERADPPSQQLAGDLGLHPEAVGLHPQIPVQRAGHELVAGLEVGDVAVEHHVGERRHELVPQDVPEGERGVTAELPAAEDDLGPTGKYGFQ
jgi:hypothetical protein